MLNKPRGVVTTLRDQKGRPDAAALVAGCGCRVWPVGRLDMDSEGLLLFTNDGDFSQMLTHPSHQVDKRYRVWVRGYTRRREEALRRPVSLDGYTIRPPGVRFLHRQEETACLEVVIHEGRNRQIRRMCGMAGLEVTRLQRVGEGPAPAGRPAPWRLALSDAGGADHAAPKEMNGEAAMAKDILARMKERAPSFTKGQRAIAGYILDTFEKAAFLTAGRLGRAVGVSESTVVRFAMELGYDGYPSMQKELQELVLKRLTAVQRMEVAQDRLKNQDVVDAVLEADMEKIRKTQEKLDRKDFQAAVHGMLRARKLYILGARSSAPWQAFSAFT